MSMGELESNFEEIKRTNDYATYNGRPFVDANAPPEIPRVPQQYLDGSAPLKEYIAYLQRMQPIEHRVSMGDYLTLVDWLTKLVELLNVPQE